MTYPCDEDWETLNAYLDGELRGAERRAFARRLAREPDLATAAAELHAQSESLARMRPVADAGSTVRGASRRLVRSDRGNPGPSRISRDARGRPNRLDLDPRDLS